MVVDDGDGLSPGLREYGLTLWRHRWLILAAVVIATGAAVALAARKTTVYEATAEVIIQPNTIQQFLSPSAQNAQDAARNVDTEVAVLESKPVRDAAMQALGHIPSVSISSSTTSNVVDIASHAATAHQAEIDANGYATAYVTYRRNQSVDELVQAGEQITAEIAKIDARLPTLTPGSPELTATQQQRAYLQQQLDQLQVSSKLSGVGGAAILATAEPGAPNGPHRLKYGVIGAVLGVLAGVGLAFVREHLDDTIRSREDLERASEGLPALAQIPRVRTWRGRASPHVVTLTSPGSAASEAYRTLRTSVEFVGKGRPLRSIQITSSKMNEGKSAVVANLAVEFARVGRKVVIVCADLRRPRIHEFFSLPNDRGLSSLLLGEVSVHDALQQVPGERDLALLAAGPPPAHPLELLSGRRAKEVIASLQQSVDIVVIDTPPVLLVSDGLVVSGMVDATLLVGSADVSQWSEVSRSIELLQQVDAPLIGTVLNMAKRTRTIKPYGTYGYAERPDRSARKARRSPRDRRTEAHEASEAFAIGDARNGQADGVIAES